MTTAVRKLFEQAKKLPPEERADLVDMLIVDAAENPDPAIEQAWLEEIQRRVDAIERGEAKLFDGDKVLKALLRGERP